MPGFSAHAQESQQPGELQQPAGAPISPKTKALAVAARLLQDKAPLGPMNIHLVGLHAMKDHPHHQMEAHHYCNQMNEDFAQCVIFDDNTGDAHLTGVEYIISESLFGTLPADEKPLWHPHNFEILSGQLSATGLPAAAENVLMKEKMNSYGKTWHFWPIGNLSGHQPEAMPLGKPMLGWSFNRDGEASPQLVERMIERNELEIGKRREQRRELTDLARPQHGVDEMKGKFGPGTRTLQGVVDVNEGNRK